MSRPDEPRPSPVKIGDVIDGRYKILRRIGEGGMSTVFLAEHWLIKRRVAMKILHSEYAADADMLRRFMNEALAAGTLGHPNIVESTDMGFTRGDVPYIVYEYIRGTLLSDEIYAVSHMPVRRVLHIAGQIASALAAAHDARIVHRDLKSDNIFLSDRGERPDLVKVIDFGISRFMAASDRTGLGSVVVGTPEFMAPEQVTNPDGVDKRADIYALGVVMYEMLAQRLPFFLGSNSAVRTRNPSMRAMHGLIDRILGEPPPALERSDAPPGLLEMVTGNLLAKDPADRYQSMHEVAAALEDFQGALRLSGPIPVVVELDDAPPAAREREREREAEGDAEIDALSDQTLSRRLLDPAVLAIEVKQLGKHWTLDGATLRLRLSAPKRARLAQVVSHVAAIADEIEHHPRIALDDTSLTVAIDAYDGKAIAVIDLVFAARIEHWLRESGF